MSNAYPIIPYELSKYFIFVSCFYGIIIGYNNGVVGILMFFLLIPALFYDLSGMVMIKDIIFNLLGALALCLSVAFFYKQKFTINGFKAILRLLLYPLLSCLSYTLVKIPTFDEVDFLLGASTYTTGGFGSNQVSTIFGLASFLLVLFILNKWIFSGKRWLDIILLFIFLLQGLLSFSRGGMLGGGIGILITLGVIFFSSVSKKRIYNLPKIGKNLFFSILVVFITFQFADYITGGTILLRYQGETLGTLKGVKEKNLNTITSGRTDIIMGDLKLFTDHVMGVGAGASKYIRTKHKGLLSHVEFSRLLAEHGLLGGLYIFCLIYIGFVVYKLNSNPLIKGILLSFFIIGIYTSFHAATRTYVPPLLVGLSTVLIIDKSIKNYIN
ncbi:MAG: hypothetical protein H6604_00995 [Flavobacteriales bacterium]|nr:hypothetical protein [Flavobacteriales bacterium]